MALAPPVLATAVAAGLAATAHLGTAMPQLALGVATGTFLFLNAAKVFTIDTGTVGVGAGLAPLIVPPPLILSSLTAGFAAQVIIGVQAPLTIAGLTIGLSTGLAAGQVITVHPSVGVGTGVGTIKGGSAVPFMLSGFASAGLTGIGTIKMATAIGIGLDICFAAYVIPVIPIAGGPGPSPSAGVGTGAVV